MIKLNKISLSGVAAIEFALIFPVLFLFLYAILNYSLIFAFQHSLSLAAAEGGRAAIRYRTNNDNQAVRGEAACFQIEKSLLWVKKMGVDLNCAEEKMSPSGALLATWEISECPFESANASLRCLQIYLKYNYKDIPLLPKLIPVPSVLTASSFTQLTLSY